MVGNTAKYLSYREAWRRIKSAKQGHFYLEVVTLCESIISDRLWSLVVLAGQGGKITNKTVFYELIKNCNKIYESSAPQFKERCLLAVIDEWRNERNEVVHGLVKSAPGTATAPVDSFLERARQAAIEGEKLARAVSKWQKQEKAARKKQAQSNDSP